MTTRIQTDRLTTPGAKPPNEAKPGTLHTNLADLQLFVTGATGIAASLLAVRIYAESAAYKTGDCVTHAGKILLAKEDLSPGAFDAAKWDQVLPGDGRYLKLTGGTLTGALALPDATLPNHAATLKQVQSETASMRVPVGTVIDFAVATPPPGYLLANGQAVARATYAALYAVIGTLYGSGDGLTTFNLPNVSRPPLVPCIRY